MIKFRKFWNWFMGYEYLVNLHTHQVHKLSGMKSNCGTQFMKNSHKWYITQYQFERLVKKQAYIDGCIHCFKEFHHVV
jgi:hypothetical protein